VVAVGLAVAAEFMDANSEKSEFEGVLEALGSPKIASAIWSWSASLEICAMSLAGAFSSAVSTAVEDKVPSSGEFSLESVWSRSESPALVEETDPIEQSAFGIPIGPDRVSFSPLTIL